MSLLIYYDGQCPFCNRYVQLLRLKESAGDVRLIGIALSLKAQIELHQNA